LQNYLATYPLQIGGKIELFCVSVHCFITNKLCLFPSIFITLFKWIKMLYFLVHRFNVDSTVSVNRMGSPKELQAIQNVYARQWVSKSRCSESWPAQYTEICWYG